MIRLATISRDFAQSFLEADPDRQRRAVLAACTAAVLSTELIAGEVDEALENIRSGRGATAQTRLRLQTLSSRFDQMYFVASNDTDNITGEASRLFKKSRAAAALAFAIDTDPTLLHEALYEAILALGESTTMPAIEDFLAIRQ